MKVSIEVFPLGSIVYINNNKYRRAMVRSINILSDWSIEYYVIEDGSGVHVPGSDLVSEIS